MKRSNWMIGYFVTLAVIFSIVVTVFVLSSQPATESLEVSDGLLVSLFRVFIKNYDSLSAAEREAIRHTYSNLIRKTAHFCEYAALGCFVLLHLNFARLLGQDDGPLSRLCGPAARTKPWLLVLFAWLAAVLYACTDEFHQLFVDGRGGTLPDILLDSFGAAAGVMFAVLILLFVWRKARRKRKNSI